MIVLAMAGVFMAGRATAASPIDPASWFDYDTYPIDAIRRGGGHDPCEGFPAGQVISDPLVKTASRLSGSRRSA